MPLVPVEQRLGLASNRRVARRQHKGGGAHFRECPFIGQGLADTIKINGEQRLSSLQTQKDALTCFPLCPPAQKHHPVCTH